MKSIKVMLFVVILLGMTTSCKEDEFANTGTLKLVFRNHPADIHATLFSVDNLDIPIDRFQVYDGEEEIDLNIGNYYIEISSSDTSYSSIGFQIKPKRTTTIFWGSDNNASVD